MPGKVYLIPTVLHEDAKAYSALPAYILQAIKDCSAFFAENEKTARRFVKRIWKEIVIDNYEWITIHKSEEQAKPQLLKLISEEKNLGIISEAGCPCIADPGQMLIDAAQQKGATVIPLVGPSAIFLALMASGMNGQCFQFVGYLPVDAASRKKILKDLEEYSYKKKCTQIFIETPYRNNQLLHDILSTCKADTKLCIAVDITSHTEIIKTKTIRQWKIKIPELNKKAAIFLLYSR